MSNEDYEVFLNRVFFKPLGMTQTGYLLPDWDPSLYPKAYFLGKVEDDTNIPKYQKANRISWMLKANGGIYSTLSDMHKWMSALASYEVLTEELINLLTDKHIERSASSKSFYGYGWSLFYSRNSNTKFVAHDGSNAFFYADIIWEQNEEPLQVIMLSNMYFKNMSSVTGKIVNIWHRPEYSPGEFKKSTWGPIAKFVWPVVKWFL